MSLPVIACASQGIPAITFATQDIPVGGMHFFNRFCVALATFLLIWALIPLAVSYGFSVMEKDAKEDDEKKKGIYTKIPSLEQVQRAGKKALQSAEEVLFDRS